MSNSDEEYEVEAILDYRIHRGKEQFYVKWKGYSEEDNTWENLSNLFCDLLIKKYLKENKEKIEKIKQSKHIVNKPKKAKDKLKRLSKVILKDNAFKYIFEQGNEKYSVTSDQVNDVEQHLIISYFESNCIFPSLEEF